MISFPKRLHERMTQTNSRVCLGIDPRPELHPSTHPERLGGDPAQVAKNVTAYFRAIIEATQGLVACYKLQSAFFEVLGIPGLVAMAQLLADIKSLDVPVILDAKRGDIGSTAEAYAQAYLADGVFSADALTVNPYLGMDSLEPFISTALKNERGLFVLVKTSNPGSGDFQNVESTQSMYLYDHVAYRLAEESRALTEQGYGSKGDDSKGYGPIGAVVGATYWQELEHLRDVLPQAIFLVPGYGAQGGGAEDVAAAFDEDGYGAVVSSSRGLTYITEGEDYAAQARAACTAMRDAINEAIGLS